MIFRPAEGPLHSTGSFPNVLAFDLEGNGAIEIEMTVKKPGPEPLPAESTTRLNLENVAEGAMPPYTSLFYDVLTGNRSLFTSSAGLAEAFRAFQPLLDHPPALETYDDDSWGPAAADRLTDGRGWQLSADDSEGDLSWARNARVACGDRRTMTAGPAGSAAQATIRLRFRPNDRKCQPMIESRGLVARRKLS